MAHFAEIGEDNIVLRVIVVSNDDCKDADGNESEAVGAEFCRNLLGGTWKQTSYNGTIRTRYAGTGYKYDSALNAYIAPQPYPSWSLDEYHDWQAPSPKPAEDKLYTWDEDNLEWKEIEI